MDSIPPVGATLLTDTNEYQLGHNEGEKGLFRPVTIISFWNYWKVPTACFNEYLHNVWQLQQQKLNFIFDV